MTAALLLFAEGAGPTDHGIATPVSLILIASAAGVKRAAIDVQVVIQLAFGGHTVERGGHNEVGCFVQWMMENFRLLKPAASTRRSFFLLSSDPLVVTYMYS